MIALKYDETSAHRRRVFLTVIELLALIMLEAAYLYLREACGIAPPTDSERGLIVVVGMTTGFVFVIAMLYSLYLDTSLTRIDPSTLFHDEQFNLLQVYPDGAVLWNRNPLLKTKRATYHYYAFSADTVVPLMASERRMRQLKLHLTAQYGGTPERWLAFVREMGTSQGPRGIALKRLLYEFVEAQSDDTLSQFTNPFEDEQQARLRAIMADWFGPRLKEIWAEFNHASFTLS